MEILFTSLHSLFHRDYKLSGKTSVWMFPIYGMASILTPLFEMLRGKSVMLRGSIYACLIFLGEFCSGSLLKNTISVHGITAMPDGISAV